MYLTMVSKMTIIVKCSHENDYNWFEFRKGELQLNQDTYHNSKKVMFKYVSGKVKVWAS